VSSWSDYLESSIGVLAQLRAALDPARVERAIDIITTALTQDRPLLVCGNGGSASDSMHIAGELVGRFHADRRALKVISLVADSAVLTAWANDIGYDHIFARQVEAYGEKGGVLLALSTSGRSKNVIAAIEAAKAKSMMTVALTGQGGAAMGPLVDILLDVPSTATPLIQQGHLCLYHYICAEVERRIIEGSPKTVG
jgi:D-sedoheptulose 7-phosphate isomerase